LVLAVVFVEEGEQVILAANGRLIQNERSEARRRRQCACTARSRNEAAVIFNRPLIAA
jgi:hypothetical protein